MHPTDHYTALGWALRDASNYICLCCLFWFGLRRTGWQSFIAGERYRDNRRGDPEPKWKWRPVMIIIDIVIVINHHQSWSDWSHNHHQFYYFCRRSNWHHRQHRQDKGWTAKHRQLFSSYSVLSFIKFLWNWRKIISSSEDDSDDICSVVKDWFQDFRCLGLCRWWPP